MAGTPGCVRDDASITVPPRNMISPLALLRDSTSPAQSESQNACSGIASASVRDIFIKFCHMSVLFGSFQISSKQFEILHVAFTRFSDSFRKLFDAIFNVILTLREVYCASYKYLHTLLRQLRPMDDSLSNQAFYLELVTVCVFKY